MKSLIWDWNGTLLNDLDFCIATINALLIKRELPELSRLTYTEVFSFPVKEYYAAIGFDFTKEDFSVPAGEFIDLYNAGVTNCALQHSANETLTHFSKMGFQQFVLSAMQQNMLEHTLAANGISKYFKAIAGLDDHYAVSKIERGEKLISSFNIDVKNALIIGDTIHDYEVAEKLGIDCILIADGHQSLERLKTTKATILPNLEALLQLNI